MTKWRPQELIINEKVRDDPVTKRIIGRYAGVVVKLVKWARTL